MHAQAKTVEVSVYAPSFVHTVLGTAETSETSGAEHFLLHYELYPALHRERERKRERERLFTYIHITLYYIFIHFLGVHGDIGTTSVSADKDKKKKKPQHKIPILYFILFYFSAERDKSKLAWQG